MKRLIKRALFRALTAIAGDSNGRVALPVLSGPARGLRFKLDLLQRMESAYAKGTYDKRILARLRTLCRPGWVAWDCGTYLGFYTVFLSRLVGPAGRVVAIEPDSRNMARTRENAGLNSCNNVTFLNAAIGGAVGRVEFIRTNNTNSHLPGMYVGASTSEYSRIVQEEEHTQVECFTLDSLLSLRGLPAPNLIKLDIEGAERDALGHAARMAADCQPLIVLELHNPECDAKAWEFARKSDYLLQNLETDTRPATRSEVFGTLLCTPRSRTCESRACRSNRELRAGPNKAF